jgi:hypothetical protein
MYEKYPVHPGTGGLVMPRNTHAVLALSAALLAATSVGAQAQSQPKLPQGFMEAQGALSAAFQSLNITAASAWFADSAVVDFQGEVFTGKQMIVENWLPTALGGLHSLRFGESTFTVNGAEVTEATQHFAENEEGTQPGNHRIRWRKVGGQWRVLRLEVVPG